MPLRKMLAEWYGVSPDEVLVSNGSLQVLEFISTLLLSPDDPVFTEEPTYDPTITLLRGHQVNLVGVPMEPGGLTIGSLAEGSESVVPKSVSIIPDLQNPAGVTTSASKRQAIVELADRHGFWVMEDSPTGKRYEVPEAVVILNAV